MESKEIIQIINDQQEDAKTLLLNSKKIWRDLTPQYLDLLPSKLIKVISGVRRCGKSYLSLSAINTGDWIYLNFDDERFANLKTKDLNEVYQAALQTKENIKYWILDEVQNIEHWDLFVNRLQRKGLNIIVTGSNGKLLSREISTHLTGRSTTIELFPFSFVEYLKYHEYKIEKHFTTEREAIIKKHFTKWMIEGGLPESFENTNKRIYLQELYDRIIARDVLQRYNLRNPKGIKQLAAVMIDSIGQEMSYKKIANQLSLGSLNTVKKYVGYLTDCYLFFELEAFSDKTRERQARPRKIYCIDNGMVNAVSASLSNNRGRQLENLVFLELRRQQKNISYLKEPTFEIDFVVTENLKIVKLIQVSWSLLDPKTKEREVSSLVKACQKLKLKSGIIITFEEESLLKIEGIEIKCIPVYQWLLLSS